MLNGKAVTSVVVWYMVQDLRVKEGLEVEFDRMETVMVHHGQLTPKQKYCQ